MFFLFVTTISWGQTISGIVTDIESGQPLPFATISYVDDQGIITDIDGLFELDVPPETTTLRISYIGYTTKIIPLISGQNFYSITLTPEIEQLNEVVLVADENPVLGIIRNAIANKKMNNPEKALESYSFKAYKKLVITANPNTIRPIIDSVFIRKEGKLIFKELDSSNYKLKKRLDRSHIYLSEKASSFLFTKEKGRQEVIEASRMAGFKQPLYEVLALKLQSFSFYNSTYTLFGTSYTNPLTPTGLKKYRFRILDTLKSKERSAYMIHYFPRNKGKQTELEGVLYIDTQSFALQKIVAQLKAIVDIKATQSYEYYPKAQIWFPGEREIKLKRGENEDRLNLFGGLIRLQQGEKDSSIVHTNQQKGEQLLYLLATEKNFDVVLNEPLQFKKRGFEVSLEDDATQRSESFWNTFRTDSITDRERETYAVVDSITEAERVERKLFLGRKFLEGYYPIGFLDFDLRRLFKYNGFEGFRNGIGVITNSKFSNKYSLNAYGVYGTKDQVIKFGFGGAARLNKDTGTWIGVQYLDDLIESGSQEHITDKRMFSLFEPRLFNITLYHATKRFSTYLDHDISSKINTRLQLSVSNIDPRFDFTFINNGENFTRYNLSEITLGVQWDPFSEHIQTPEGKKITKNAFPQFSFQASQSIANIFRGDFNFTQFNFRVRHRIYHKNENVTQFLVKAGLAFGDIPLTHLFNTSPNQPSREAIIQRFSVTGRESFETMFFNEFFSDRYISGQIKHTLKPFKISNRINPSLSLISRAVIGDVSNQDQQIGLDFNSLNQGFFESGFEFNRIFAGFGLSFFYRYGAYTLPNFEDNVSFKFTYYFGLGF